MVIEKGVPRPTQCSLRGKWKRIAQQMDVDDSVLLDSEREANSLRHALIRAGRNTSLRKVEGGWRVWRLA